MGAGMKSHAEKARLANEVELPVGVAGFGTGLTCGGSLSQSGIGGTQLHLTLSGT